MSSSATSKKPKQQQQQQNRPATPGKRKRGRQPAAAPASTTQKRSRWRQARRRPSAHAWQACAHGPGGACGSACFVHKEAGCAGCLHLLPILHCGLPGGTASFDHTKAGGTALPAACPPPPDSGEGYYADADWMALAINWSRTATQVRRQRLSGVPPPLRVDEVASGAWKCEELAGGWGARVHAGNRVWARSFAAGVPSAEVEGDVLEAVVWVLGREGGQDHTDELVR
ncbi:hypothetical protein BDZ88DRAFT_506777 [Geranomyces variabilis]|nr:hypothetical protein BDZ88DRAFT_506777 [Geranomyces variabilis]